MARKANMTIMSTICKKLSNLLVICLDINKIYDSNQNVKEDQGN